MTLNTPLADSESLQKNQLEDVFETPEILITAPQLSTVRKQELLEQWRMDLEAKLRASDENMTTQEPDNKSSELLRRVKIAQQNLDKHQRDETDH